MFFLRILIAACVIAYVVWFFSNRILGKNLLLTRIIAIALVAVSLIFLLLGILSYLLEGSLIL
ncbi:MAG: hypothetical protein HAW58_06585 [Candidatus Thioglobus sp.]|nr:hypothetical protein [Candidatus Thioglobus sp.]